MKSANLLFICLSISIFLSIGCNSSRNLIIAKGGEEINIDFKYEIINNNMQLTIYFFTPLSISTATPLTSEYVINHYIYKTIVSNSTLKDHIGVLQKIEKIKLKKPINFEYEDTRIYCEFNAGKRKLLSFSLSSTDTLNMLVNNLVVKNERVFYELIIPFVPQSEVDYYKEDLKDITF